RVERMTDGDQRAADDAPVEKRPIKEDGGGEDRRLRGHDPEPVALAEKREPFREAREVADAARQALRKPAKQTVGAERDDERQRAEARDDRPIQRARDR